MLAKYRLERPQDTVINRMDYVELGLACDGASVTLKRGLDGRSEDGLNDSVREAIKQLRKGATSATPPSHSLAMPLN